MSEKKTPNPYSEKGKPDHQKKVVEVANDIEKRQMDFIPEFQIETTGGKKSKGFAGVVALNNETTEVEEMHQVVKCSKQVNVVKRERDAKKDIENSKAANGKKVIFHKRLILTRKWFSDFVISMK